MEKFLFMDVVLKKIADVNFIRGMVNKVLKILACFFSFLGLFLFFSILRNLRYLPGGVAFVTFLFAIAILIIVYMVVHILIIRAGELNELQLEDYPIITMASKILRLIGELYVSIILLFMLS